MNRILFIKKGGEKILILVGKSASGKSEILKSLKGKGMNTIVPYTTRPPRIGERNGIDYNFISNDEFESKEQSDFFAETSKYLTTDGVWKYGSSISDYNNDTVIVLNPDGLKKIKNIFPNATAIYIVAPESVRLRRSISRINPNKEDIDKTKNEIDRRFKADEEDFKEIYKYVNGIFCNDDVKSSEEFDKNLENLLKMYLVLKKN